MVNDKVDRNEGFDDPGIFSHPAGSAAHRGEVAEERHPGEVLEEDAGDDERDLFGAMGCRLPGRELPDVLLRDLLAVAIAEDRFKDDPDRDRQAGYPVKAGLLKGGKGIELPSLARTGIELTKGIE
jgi:hypothetical protein